MEITAKKSRKPDVRHLDEIRKLLFDKKWARTAPNLELYYMYRGVKKKNNLRYDITVIPPLMLGKEFVKTKGNHNSKNFAEFYTVIEGTAIILMQKIKSRIVKDAVAIRLEKGDALIEPPDYDVVTINPSKNILKIANWVSEKNKNIYENVEKMNGACYFYTKSGWIKNKNYTKIPPLRFEKPLKVLPKNLDFLYGKN